MSKENMFPRGRSLYLNGTEVAIIQAGKLKRAALTAKTVNLSEPIPASCTAQEKLRVGCAATQSER